MKKVCLWISVIIVAIAVIWVGCGIIRSKTFSPKNPVATIYIEGYEKPIKVELDVKSAPNAVANFVKLANSGFYNDYKMTINEKEIVSKKGNEKARLSRIVDNPKQDYIYGIKGDLLSNDVDNKIRHKKGVITMHIENFSYFGLTEEGYNSANSTFGILTEDNSSYDNYYIGFGKVIEGMDVLDAIAATRVSTDENATTENTAEGETEETEKNVIVIKSITVDTFGQKYSAPEYVNYEENLAKVNELCTQYFGTDFESLFQ